MPVILESRARRFFVLPPFAGEVINIPACLAFNPMRIADTWMREN
jgi:hypothetical protein